MDEAGEVFDIVEELVSRGYEGSWWDFKSQWPSKEALLHDIICLANNTDFVDSYLIIGVDDQTHEYLDIQNDSNRYNTQKLNQFIRGKAFAGNYYPEVIVFTLAMNSDCSIDVIKIKKSDHVPFYLEKNTYGIQEGGICTRIGDSNVPKGATADYRSTEQLWRHHFGIDLLPIERFHRYLQDKDNWRDSPEHSEGLKEFYAPFPEFTLEQLADDSRNGFTAHHALQCDKSARWEEVLLRYHQTVIYGAQTLVLDGGRYYSTVPNEAFLRTPNHDSLSHQTYSYAYGYFIKNTMIYDLHRYFYKDDNPDERLAYERFMQTLVVYEDESEKLDIEAHIILRPEAAESEIDSIEPIVSFPETVNERSRAIFTDYLRITRYIQDLLEEHRGEPLEYKCPVYS